SAGTRTMTTSVTPRKTSMVTASAPPPIVRVLRDRQVLRASWVRQVPPDRPARRAISVDLRDRQVLLATLALWVRRDRLERRVLKVFKVTWAAQAQLDPSVRQAQLVRPARK